MPRVSDNVVIVVRKNGETRYFKGACVSDVFKRAAKHYGGKFKMARRDHAWDDLFVTEDLVRLRRVRGWTFTEIAAYLTEKYSKRYTKSSCLSRWHNHVLEKNYGKGNRVDGRRSGPGDGTSAAGGTHRAADR